MKEGGPALPEVPNFRECSVLMTCASTVNKGRVVMRLQAFKNDDRTWYAAKLNFSGNHKIRPFAMACSSYFKSVHAAALELKDSAQTMMGRAFNMCPVMRDALAGVQKTKEGITMLDTEKQ